jgi:hypothetical protein
MQGPGPAGAPAPPQAFAGVQPSEQPLFAMAAQPPFNATPSTRFEGIPSNAGPPPVVQIPCPACGMTMMATPGQPSVCFSCGQPWSGDVTNGGGGGGAPRFPITDAMNARPIATPSGALVSPQGSSGATIRGSAGQFTIRPGAEVRVGRDPAACTIFLGEPRVSGVHATLKFEEGRLMVRDETSNNGTWISGARIAPGTWTPVTIGTPLRFGPVEFTVQLDG